MKITLEHKSEIRPKFSALLADKPKWARYLAKAPHIHLAVLIEPYLEYIFAGKKTVESRFSLNRVAPFEEVQENDVVLLKRSGGPIVGLALVGQTDFYHLLPSTWRQVKSLSREICADAEFWYSRKDKRYASLMHISDITPIDPIAIEKADRRAWVVLDKLGTLV